MSRTTAEILAVIEAIAGDGSCPLGFDIFRSAEVFDQKDLHANYTYDSAVRYLMRMRPENAADLQASTHVENLPNN